MREVFYGVVSQGATPYIFMEEKICTFFGHREIKITDDLYATTTAEILKSVDFGCRTFYFGGYGDFDALCYEIVTRLKVEREELNLKRVFCVPREEYLRKRVRYFKREDYDDVIYLEPSFNGWYKSIYFRNCAMIDRCDYIIFYFEDRVDSGAYKAYQYAKKKKAKMLFNLYP